MIGQFPTPHSVQNEMKKIFPLAGLCILFGCSPQKNVFYTTELKNACDYPIDVSIPEKHRKFLLSEKHYLNSGEAMAVLALICRDASRLFTIKTSSWAIGAMMSCLPADYELKITADAKELTLGEQQLWTTLERAEYEGGKTSFLWTISDPSLCPK